MDTCSISDYLHFLPVLIFQKEEEGFEHQEAMMPSVPAPDGVTNLCLTFPVICCGGQYNVIAL